MGQGRSQEKLGWGECCCELSWLQNQGHYLHSPLFLIVRRGVRKEGGMGFCALGVPGRTPFCLISENCLLVSNDSFKGKPQTLNIHILPALFSKVIVITAAMPEPQEQRKSNHSRSWAVWNHMEGEWTGGRSPPNSCSHSCLTGGHRQKLEKTYCFLTCFMNKLTLSRMETGCSGNRNVWG